MDTEAYSFALRGTLKEIQKICPEIKNVFALTKSCELLARDEGTSESTIDSTVKAFEEMLERAEAIGGIEEIAIEANNGRLNVSCLDEIYLVTVTSKSADSKYVNTITHVLVPTVLKLLEKLSPAPVKENRPMPEMETEEPETEEPSIEPAEEPSTENVEEPEEDRDEERSEPEEKPESMLAEAPVNQFIVEDMKGLLAPSDTVRIDSNTIKQWNELYQDKTIEEADIETFGGKSVRCKVKPIKDAKLDGQGKIQIPSKVQATLDIRKGELVRVKPAVE